MSAESETPPIRLDRLPMAEDRTAAYSFLRAAGPVLRTAFGSYLITSAETAEYALRHPALFSSRRAFDLVGSPLPLVPIAFDPPEHTRYRRILQPFFSPRGVAAWLPQVRALARELIDGVARQGHCDLVSDLAVPLPAQVFLTLFGLPVEDRDRLNTWKEGLLRATPGVPGETRGEHAVQMGTELFEYLVEHVAQRRQDSTGISTGRGLFGQLLTEPGDDRLSDEEIYGLAFLFVLAGLETVTSALSTAFAVLASQPPLRSRIVDDPAVIPAAVEELLRVDGPLLFVPRVTTQDVEVAGQVIPAGALVQVMVAVADRDPAGHPDPDVIDFGRQERSLAFGGGPHRCLGSHLARMEMRVAIEEWHRRIPEYQLAPGPAPRVTWPAGVVGIRHLPLVFPAR